MTKLPAQTQITPPLKDIRGLKAVLGAMRFSQDPVLKCFLEKRDSLGVWARENTPWEAIGLAARIDLIGLHGASLLARWEHSNDGRAGHRHLLRSGSNEKASRVRPTFP